MGLLDNATGFARRFLMDRSTQLPTYKPVEAAIAPFSIRVRSGNSSSRLLTEEAFGVKVDSEDFLIDAAELQRWLPRDPKRGDQITRTIGRSTITWEVLPFGSEAEWRWSDPATRSEYRVHVKEVRSVLN